MPLSLFAPTCCEHASLLLAMNTLLVILSVPDAVGIVVDGFQSFEEIRETLFKKEVADSIASHSNYYRYYRAPAPSPQPRPSYRYRRAAAPSTAPIAEPSPSSRSAITTSEPEWRNLGGAAMSRPCCVSWISGRMDCFVRGTDSKVWQKTLIKGSIDEEWQSVGDVTINGDISCVSRTIGVIDLAVLSLPSNAMTVNTYQLGRWGEWKRLGGILAEAPTCVSIDRHSIDCVYRGIDNLAFHNAYKNGLWGSASCVGVEFLTPLRCVEVKSRRFDCYGAGSDNELRQLSFDNGAFEGSVNVGGYVLGQPSALSFDGERIDVFARTLENGVAQKTWDGEWFRWSDLGGVVDSDPECVATSDYDVYCFAIGYNSTLFKNVWGGSKWSGWQKESSDFGHFVDRPACVVTSVDEVLCALRNTKRETILVAYKA